MGSNRSLVMLGYGILQAHLNPPTYLSSLDCPSATHLIPRGVVYIHGNLWLEQLHPKSHHQDSALPPILLKLESTSPRECGSMSADTKSHGYDVAHIPEAFAFSPRFVRKILCRCYIKYLYIKI